MSKAWLDQQHFKQKLLTRVCSCATLNSKRSGSMQAMRNVTRLIELLGDSRLTPLEPTEAVDDTPVRVIEAYPERSPSPEPITQAPQTLLAPWPMSAADSDLRRLEADLKAVICSALAPPKPVLHRDLAGDGDSERPLPSARTAGSTRSQRPRLDHRYCHGSGCCRRGIRVMGTRPRAKCRHTARRASANTQWTRRTRASQ